MEKPKSVLSLIRGNRHELRKRGLTAADLLVLEAAAAQAPSGFKRLSCASLGRLVGVCRETARHHVERLERFGAIVRLGPAMMVNARSVLQWVVDAAKGRDEWAKRLFLKRHSQLVRRRLPHGIKKVSSGPLLADLGLEALDRAAALRDLAALYVPVHLRKGLEHGRSSLDRPA